MKSISEKLEQLFSAVTFAESGEFETARQIMKEEPAVEKPAKNTGSGLRVATAVTEA